MDDQLKKVLDCVWCGVVLPVNEMFSVDACCEEHQRLLDTPPYLPPHLPRLPIHDGIRLNIVGV